MKSLKKALRKVKKEEKLEAEIKVDTTMTGALNEVFQFAASRM